MLAWIASYPRSGNTFMRMVLNQVFDLPSASAYDGDLRFFVDNPDMISAVGQVERDHDRPFCLKSHDLPSDDAPAIYVVRDGRAAIVSYYHFLRDIEKTEVPIEDVIKGKRWPYSWSDHVAAWGKSREQTLLVRYEDMLSDLPAVIDRVGTFLDLKPLRTADIDFAKLHALHPAFFRKGDNVSSIEEITPHLALFDLHHGKTMRQLGYDYDGDLLTLRSAQETRPSGAKVTYARYGEDLTILHLLGEERVGRYIDVESEHALHASNTALLHSAFNWSGLNISANPTIVASFERLRPRDGNLHHVVGPKGTGGSWPGGANAASARPLQEIIDSWLAPDDEIHLLNVADEGAVLPTITTLDWKRHQPLLVALKIDENRSIGPEQVLAFQFMAAQGYEMRSCGVATALFKRRFG